MSIIYDEEYFKPIQCSKCGSQNIVKPMNERYVLLRCLDCGHEQVEAQTVRDHYNTSSVGWGHEKNTKPYREF